jgi:2-polyprenyl-3-methyl-5-hydroxy-6-metoxy-1,4-benzoquinol methylase
VLKLHPLNCPEEGFRTVPFSLAQRQRQPELMDDPNLDSLLHLSALTGLKRINRLSRTTAQLWQSIQNQRGVSRPGTLRILDVGCGGGDTVFALEKLAVKDGVDLVAHGCDISVGAIEIARSKAAQQRTSAEFFELDVLGDQLPHGYHFLVSSLFLHHLSSPQVIALLGKMNEAAEVGVIISDLERLWRGYFLALLGTQAVTRSSVVHIDSRRSVSAAFRLEELRELARISGLGEFELIRCWPCRMLLSWRTS